ncbi:peptidase domain-containing ABC transporter [Staphylococcus felis]|uniref:peptidase domain-containing ABC transporter n=2 Tax=Staphylococcus felis TaxID=46127 RepID=UPI00247FC6BB|nr:peptidase domain-containing ABC transporter [Staphylococcus felis]
MRFKFIEQPDERDCGPTCLAMICKYYKKKVSISKIRILAGTDLYGTNLLGMMKAGEKLGLKLEAYEVENLDQLHKVNAPFIAHILNDEGFEHFVVIKKITNKYLYITDPARGHYKMTKSEFHEIFTNVVLTVENDNTKDPIESFTTSNYFKDIFKNNHSFIWLILITSLVINTIGFIGAFYFKFLVDNIIPSTFFENLHNFSLAILMLYIISFLVSLLRYQLTLNMGLKINKKLMLEYYKHILYLPMNFFETRKDGEILSRFRDSDHIREAFSTITVTLFIDVTMILVGSVILYIQSTTLFLVVLSILPVYVLIAVFFKKPFEKYNREEMEADAKVSSIFLEGVRGIDTIKSYGSELQFFKKAESYFLGLIKKAYNLGTYTNLQISLKEFMGLISILLILWIGATKVMSGDMTLGELLTFNALVAYYLGPVDRLLESQSVIQSALVATKRVIEITDLDQENHTDNEKIDEINFNSDISFNNVSFYYGQRENILNNINFSIPKGKKIALVGESGSGKSTIAKLLLNYYNPQYGNICIDKYNLNDLKLTEWRNKIAYVSQQNFIFYGTVKDNLTIGYEKKSLTEVELIEACKIAEAHNFISQLPQGYNTVLETNGENLSGGQIQRIALARAILSKPEILILDEPTSSLDSSTEKKIQNNLYKLDTTLLIISHRLSVVYGCDNIIVLKNGRVSEQGTHKELLSRKNDYYKLWKNQLVKD